MNNLKSLSSSLQGHLLAFLTIIIWGTTFVSTKILLRTFDPIQILLIRFVLGYAALWIISPHRLGPVGLKAQLLMAAAGLCGITLYYLLENIALQYTSAANIGLIISTAPFFTVCLCRIIYHEKGLSPSFLCGLFLALCGIALISFGKNGTSLHPFGDALGLLAAFVWALYTVLMKKIGTFGLPTIALTRRTFAWGLLFMIPFLLKSGSAIPFDQMLQPVIVLNLLYLGLGASALCFVTWNQALNILGAASASLYIDLVPVVTALSSMLVLHEPLSIQACSGIALTIMGLLISDPLLLQKIRSHVPGKSISSQSEIARNHSKPCGHPTQNEKSSHERSPQYVKAE